MISPKSLRRILLCLFQTGAGCSSSEAPSALDPCFLKRRIAVLAMALAAIFAAIGRAQESTFPNPVFPFGAVYFRKSNPPAQDWERDHQVAAGLGVNIFFHWVL